ncbi:PrsW family glutamic-type intramembrane protease [Planctomycetota bacterium]|nr:PrsW family glutamic-type intramembrane protease [Planctomycetota bacterium]
MFRIRVEAGDRVGETFPLPEAVEGPVLVGRGRDAHIQFATDTTMSRVHAELHLRGGTWFLKNLSKHGSHVGRKKVTAERKLGVGDVLILGETRVVFEQVSGRMPAMPDSLTPSTPTIAVPSGAAGYDTQGLFHMGHTQLGQLADDVDASFINLGGNTEQPGVRVKVRSIYFLLVVGVLALAGCLSTGLLIVLPAATEYPRDMLAATAFALVPAVPYVVLIKLLDRNGQIPWRNFLACVVWGGTVGCGFSLVLNAFGGSALGTFFSADSAAGLTTTVVAPLVEEVVKGLGVLALFWILHDEFDNVLEGMVLGAASGLGFALVENMVYDVRFLVAEGGGTTTLLFMGTYRALVNALIGHPVYTAMTGAGLGLLREMPRSKRARLVMPVAGLAIAVTLHVLWNWAAVHLGDYLGEEGLRTLLVHTVVFGGVGLAFFGLAYGFAAGRERRVLLTYLGEEVDKGFVQPQELDTFRHLLGGLRYEFGGLLSGGPAVYFVRRTLRRAQVELAFRKWHLAKGDMPRGGLVDSYVLEARTKIRDARNKLNKLAS